MSLILKNFWVKKNPRKKTGLGQHDTFFNLIPNLLNNDTLGL